MTIPSGIEVFQDLKLLSKNSDTKLMRKFIINMNNKNWIHNSERESELEHITSIREGSDYIVFRYIGKKFPKADLYLFFGNDGFCGYKVTNIVPVAPVLQLNYGQYNSILQDFSKQISTHHKVESPFTQQISPSTQSIIDWVTEKTAKALESFSNAANKSTLTGHPQDRERWERFVIYTHMEHSMLDAEFLQRWLNEILRWDSSSSSELAIKYENARSILASYDNIRRELQK